MSLKTHRLDNAEIDEVGRIFDDDDVAGIAEDFAGEVEQLLRAVGDDDVVGRET